MSNAPYRPDALKHQMFLGNQATQSGLLTSAQLRGRAWTRVRNNVYIDSRVEPDHALRIRGAIMALPSGLVVAGQSAAVLLGIDSAARASDRVHLIAPNGQRLGHRNGVRVHSCDLAPTEIVVRADLPCTSAARTAWDLGRWLDPLTSVPIIDAFLGRGLVTVEILAETADFYRGARGGRAAAQAFSLADGGSQSPPESLLRVRFVISGLPRPVSQFPIMLPNGILVHPDICWPKYQVACEYDGLWHGTDDQLHLDRMRLNGLVSADWIVLHVTSRRLYRDYDGVLAEVRAALMKRGWRHDAATSV
jgi:hypothetical protein